MRLILLMLGVAIAGCDNSLDRPIHFVLPDSFSGPFVIVVNPAYPDAIVRKSDRYEVTVPLDGVFRTNNIGILQRWHKLAAAYENGNRLPTEESDLSAVHSGETSYGRDKTSLSWYYVGPYDEFKAFMYDSKNPGKLDAWLKERGVTE